LYLKVKAIKLEADQMVETFTHRGQVFVVTRNEDLIPENEDELYSNMMATLAESQIFIAWDEDNNEAKDYGPEDFRYVRTRMFIGDNAGGLWMTLDALNFQTTPFWLRIGDALGPTRSISSTPDGNTVWLGTSNGTLMRVNNLNNIDIDEIKANDTDFCNSIAEFMDFEQNLTGSATTVSGRPITGIATHPFDENSVYYSVGGYNAEEHVFEVSNAGDADLGEVSVSNISGNLPKMPVYDLVVSNPQAKIIAGTEYGIWVGDLTEPVESMWSEENGGDLNPVPVFSVREEFIAPDDLSENSLCRVLYAGTYGRGVFRTTSLTNPGCGLENIGGCQNVSSGIEEIATTEISVYPNPAAGIATVTFNLSEDLDLEVSIFSITGQLVKRIDKYKSLDGNNTVQLNITDVPNGSYIVVLRAGDYQAATKLNVAH